MTMRVCIDVPEAMFVKAHAASNYRQGCEGRAVERDKKKKFKLSVKILLIPFPSNHQQPKIFP